ncbi:MAG: DUF4931 domain-containing protein [Dethiobacteria bacterium]
MRPGFPAFTHIQGGVVSLPEFRRDIISGQWVIIAADRVKRPETFACKGKYEIDHAALPERMESCPFCPGNEGMTPPEVLALGRREGTPDSPGWRVRVVPNMFPAVRAGDGSAGEARPGEGAFFYREPGCGVHEVLIETTAHNRHPGSISREQMRLVVDSYYRRYQALSGNQTLRFIMIFRNHGREAGASIEHPHSQLIALPFIPGQVRMELEGAHEYYLNRRECPYCRLLEEERRSGIRMVAENSFFSAYMPFASRYPFETWLLPRRHQSSFLDMEEKEREALAALLNEVLGRLSLVLDDPPYNFYLHSAPLRLAALPHYHWHLELIPKLTATAAFEMGAGVFINVVVPEEAAAFLRNKGGDSIESRGEGILCPGLAQSPTRG